MVDFVEAVKMFYSRAFDFNGRSSRSEYWWVQLFMTLALLASVIPLVFFVFGTGLEGSDEHFGPIAILFLGVFLVVWLVHFVPSIALVVRRFHDLNQTGWLYLIFLILSFIPIIGLLVSIGMIVWFCFRGTDGPNQYGPDPLEYDFDRGF